MADFTSHTRTRGSMGWIVFAGLAALLVLVLVFTSGVSGPGTVTTDPAAVQPAAPQSAAPPAADNN